MNDISATIFYNQRIILSAPIETPVTWHCSKVEQTSPKGSNRLTFAQNEWDNHKDAFEYEDGLITSEYISDKHVIGMWADYYTSEITPTDSETINSISNIRGEFTYSAKPQLKIGGNYKKFNLKFYENNELIPTPNGYYSFMVDGEEIDSLLITTIQDVDSIKIKFNGGDEWINKVMQIKYITDDGIIASVDVEIVPL